MNLENQFPHRLLVPARVGQNQFLDRAAAAPCAGVVLAEQFIQRLLHQHRRARLVHHVKLRIEFQFVEMAAHQLETKAVQRADGSGVEQCKLFLKRGVRNAKRGISSLRFPRSSLLVPRFLQGFSNPRAHLRRRRFGERDHQNVFQRAALSEEPHATRHERARLACARACGDEHVALGVNRPLLCVRRAHASSGMEGAGSARNSCVQRSMRQTDA